MSARTFDELREDYRGTPLRERDVDPDPIAQFRAWFDEAVAAEIPLANGMTLATATPGAVPSARVVLLKGVDTGFVFFTNYASRKAEELERNPHASLSFWWEPLARQVRIEGTVERVSAAESDAYFATRPREANLGAIASPQSRPVEGREDLEAAVEKVREQWEGRELERPDSWGGYRLVPDAVEFWQGRESRLHDRLRYRRDGEAWTLERLAP